MNHETNLEDLDIEENVENTESVFEEKESLTEEAAPTRNEKKPKMKKDQEQELSKGALLKQVREEKGLSLDIVHEATKIPMDALRAIEEGYTVRILSPFYVKGFLKIYAKYLGVDVNDVLQDYKKEELPKYVKQDVEEFNIQKFLSKFFTKKRKQRIVIGIGIALSLFFLFKIIVFFANRPKSAKKANTVKVALDKKKVESQVSEKVNAVNKTAESAKPAQANRAVEVVQPKAEPPVVKPAVKAVVPPVEKIAKNVNLTVRATDRSWLRVKSDGEVVFQSTLSAGAAETWIADKEIEISGRNISELQFELNGKLIGALSRNDRNVKKVLFTNDGLKVIK